MLRYFAGMIEPVEKKTIRFAAVSVMCSEGQRVGCAAILSHCSKHFHSPRQGGAHVDEGKNQSR